MRNRWSEGNKTNRSWFSPGLNQALRHHYLLKMGFWPLASDYICTLWLWHKTWLYFLRMSAHYTTISLFRFKAICNKPKLHLLLVPEPYHDPIWVFSIDHVMVPRPAIKMLIIMRIHKRLWIAKVVLSHFVGCCFYWTWFNGMSIAFWKLAANSLQLRKSKQKNSNVIVQDIERTKTHRRWG